MLTENKGKKNVKPVQVSAAGRYGSVWWGVRMVFELELVTSLLSTIF